MTQPRKPANKRVTPRKVTRPTNKPFVPKVRLLRVVLQAALVIEDEDGDLHEVSTPPPGNPNGPPPIIVAGKQWREYGAISFGKDELAAIGQQWLAERSGS